MLQVGDEGVLDLLQQDIFQFVLVKKKGADVIISCLVTRVSRCRKINTDPTLHHLIVNLENLQQGSVPYILPEINL